jgi:Reverse transcriptase (RNA-dependent DNA polymerase)
MRSFEKWDGGIADTLRERPQIGYHMVFDTKLDCNFTRKARIVANGNETSPPPGITYASVVSRDSVRVALLYASLNDIDVLSCDVGNAYLNTNCREKLWVEAGPEFGSDEGSVMIIRKALYGLSSSGAAAWRAMVSQTLIEQGYVNTIADSDVWRRYRVTEDGFEYYELTLV